MKKLMEAVLEEAPREGTDLFLVFPNENSSPILRRRGWVPLQPVPVLGMPLRLGPILGRALRGGVRWRRLASGALVYGWKRRKMEPPDESVIQESASVPEGVEEAWRAASRDYPLVVRRDKAYLEWRYQRCPTKSYRFLFARDRDGASGYAVIRTGVDGIGYVVDLFGPRNPPSVLGGLASVAREALAKDGAIAILAKALSPHAQRALEGAGLVPLPRPSWETLCGYGQAAEMREESRGWWLTRGDADTEMP